ncbi:MAG: GlsB/YeaQ/YmgE family stress response membrane protein [Chlorobi bacterium]|nr:GlsB/YeaQ/YmgE family stress response membrane protein [Chlorobiota bacterium]
MWILWTAIIGLIAGSIAKLLMPGKDPGGIVITILLGVAGSIAATFLGKLLGLYNEGDSAGFIASILGAMLLLWIYRLVKGKQQQASA